MADLDYAESSGNSILEYSLAELAFILFFLLLLFIGYQVNEHQDELEKKDEEIARKDTEIARKDTEIARKDLEFTGLEREKKELDEDVSDLKEFVKNAFPTPEDGGDDDPDAFVDVLILAADNAETVEIQKAQIDKLTEQLGAARDLNARTTQRLSAAVARGGITLCTFEIPAEGSDGTIKGPSATIATVYVDAGGITLLEHGFPQGKTFVDYYNEPFDSELFRRAFEIINKWNLKELYDWDQFRDLARGLNQIGDDYKNDTRKECRFHFAYYYEESLPPSLSEDFKVMVYHNSRRILREEYLRLINNGL